MSFSTPKTYLLPLGLCRIQRLPGPPFRGQPLFKADLRGAAFERGSDLQGTSFSGVDLTGVSFDSCDLRRAHLSNRPSEDFGIPAGLAIALTGSRWDNIAVGVVFDNADLEDADFRGVNLSGGSFIGSNLRNADLNNARLSFVTFEPAPDSVALIKGLSSLRDLVTLTYKDDPSALIILRDEYRKRGMREQEREVSYAIHRRE